MRYTFIYTLIIGLMALLSGCVINDEEGRNHDALKRAIWNEAQDDLAFVSRALAGVDAMSRVLDIEDEVEREHNLAILYPNSTFEQEGDTYVVTTKTSYGTTYKIKYVTDGKSLSEGGSWSVEHTGGSGYNLRLTPLSEGDYRAEFLSLNIAESRGSADFEVEFDYMEDATKPLLRYVAGSITMVDRLGSSSSPVTLTSDIRETLVCANLTSSTTPVTNTLISGAVDVECHDALYGATDRIRVVINNSIPTIEYLSGSMAR